MSCSRRTASERSADSAASAALVRPCSRQTRAVPSDEPTSASVEMIKAEATTEGCRRAHLTTRSQAVGRRARIGRSARNRLKSSARSRAVAYRLPGSLAIAFKKIVSSSRGIAGSIRLGAIGSSCAIRRSSSCRSVPATAGLQRQQLVERHPQGVDVGAVVHRPAMGQHCSGLM